LLVAARSRLLSILASRLLRRRRGAGMVPRDMASCVPHASWAVQVACRQSVTTIILPGLKNSAKVSRNTQRKKITYAEKLIHEVRMLVIGRTRPPELQDLLQSCGCGVDLCSPTCHPTEHVIVPCPCRNLRRALPGPALAACEHERSWCRLVPTGLVHADRPEAALLDMSCAVVPRA